MSHVPLVIDARTSASCIGSDNTERIKNSRRNHILDSFAYYSRISTKHSHISIKFILALIAVFYTKTFK